MKKVYTKDNLKSLVLIKLGCLQSTGCELIKLKMFVVMCNLENIITDTTYFLFSPV